MDGSGMRNRIGCMARSPYAWLCGRASNASTRRARAAEGDRSPPRAGAASRAAMLVSRPERWYDAGVPLRLRSMVLGIVALLGAACVPEGPSTADAGVAQK